ncbi:peptide deformylase [Candidatus Omnitrophota bacterium]
MGQIELKTYPDPCLRIKTKPVEHFDQELKNILKSMADIMYISQGIGLAAPQVGLGLSLFVIDIGEGLMNFINPEIIERSKKKSAMEEGCLSLPGALVNVGRPNEVKIRAQDENGEYFIKKFDELTAKAVQHEYDHLQGRVIIDYLDPIRRFLMMRKLARTKDQQKNKTCEVVCHVGKRTDE